MRQEPELSGSFPVCIPCHMGRCIAVYMFEGGTAAGKKKNALDSAKPKTGRQCQGHTWEGEMASGDMGDTMVLDL